ncbi:hypothetical protein DNTS_002838, partial [Danionella cerebrum]
QWGLTCSLNWCLGDKPCVEKYRRKFCSRGGCEKIGASSLPSDSPSNRKHLFQSRPINSRRGMLLLAAHREDILRAQSESNTTGIVSNARLGHLGAKRRAHIEPTALAAAQHELFSASDLMNEREETLKYGGFMQCAKKPQVKKGFAREVCICVKQSSECLQQSTTSKVAYFKRKYAEEEDVQGSLHGYLQKQLIVCEERSCLLRLSLQKLRFLEDPEVFLRRSVLINNLLRKLHLEEETEHHRKRLKLVLQELLPYPSCPPTGLCCHTLPPDHGASVLLVHLDENGLNKRVSCCDHCLAFRFKLKIGLLKERFVRFMQYLEDPQHVARFQWLCGVRGTDPQGTLGNRESGTRGEEFQNEGGDASHVTTRRRMDTEKRNNGLANGAVGENVTGRAEDDGENDAPCSAVKPLRRNSLTGDIGQEFIIENKFLFYMFTLGTELGNELFYISFFPFLMWNVDAFVSRRLVVVWVWVMYLGQCTKDLIRCPRPSSPPVVKVEMFYNSEYSMPSTHAMSGTAIPLSLFLLTYDRWEYPMLLGLSLAISWCVLVCLSRIYMGMHSILDVIAGFLYSLLILLLFSPALEIIDTFNCTHPYAPLFIISLHVGLGLFSFTLDTWSTSRGDTAQILGSGAGIALASHVNSRLGLLPDPPAAMLPLHPPSFTLGLIGLCILRFFLGVLILLATRAVMKALTIPLVCRLFGIPCDDVRKARQHMEVELPYRYIVYGTVGLNALYLVPLLFAHAGLL